MPVLPNHLLSRLSEHLGVQMGWHFPPARWHELAAGIEAAARESGIANSEAYARTLLQEKLSDAQIEVLAGAFTVGETYFFRDPQSFDILADSILPQLIDERRASERRLRIWSAGCCTGEEAYSLAILLDRLLPDQQGWQITLLATDVNVRFLQKAAKGVFGEWSFRGAPPWLKERYFRPVERRRFELLPRIRSRVRFAYLNLIEDTYPSLINHTNAMDLILCRNVLMYFSPELAARVVGNFHRSLVVDGWFLTSAVETSPRLSGYFDAGPFDGATFYRRRRDIDVVRNATPAAGSEIVVDAIVTAPYLTAPTVAADSRHSDEVNFAASPAPRMAQMEQPVFSDDAYANALRLFEAGKYREAADAALPQPDAAKLDADRAILLARIYANLGDLSAARTWAERAIDTDRTNALSHYLRAEILQEQNQPEEAALALQRTLYLQPQFVLAHFALGNLEQHQGRVKVAARHFKNALALLRSLDDNEVLPHSEGMVVGRLKEMILSMTAADAA